MSFISTLNLLGTTSRICMSPDNGDQGGGGGGNGDGNQQQQSSMINADDIKKQSQDPNAGNQQQQQQQQDDPNKQQQQQQDPGQKADRPAWLKDDKFWDAEKGQVRSEELHKSFSELEKKFHNGDHKAPAKAEDYKLNFNDEQKTILFGKTDVDAKAIADDPGIKALTGWGAKHKVSQEAINELLGEYAGFVGPELEKVTIDIAAEKKILGNNADGIIKNQMDFFGHLYRSGHINDKHLAELQILGETAAGIQAIQKIREYYGEQPIPTTATAGDGMPTKAELSAMLNDPKYDTDPDHKAKVDALYAKMYGTQPAMSSSQNR